MRICFVISSLGPGGAERVAATLVNEWTRVGHQISVITLALAELDFYRLDRSVERRAVGLMAESRGLFQGVARNLHRVRRLRRELRTVRPDAIVSFMDRTNVLVLIAAIGLGTPVVVSERIDPREHPLGMAWKALRRLVYRRARMLVVQTESVAEWARGVANPRHVAVIPNPVGMAATASPGSRTHRVVAVGRLVPQKGFDMLIAAFDRAAATHPDWTLVIAGEGPLEGTLRRQAGSTRSANQIVFAGLVANPEELLRDSEILVLSSRFEGFPNVLVEAMACGCCVIATDCPSGPAEIVTSGIDGVLIPVDDVAALAGSLRVMMADGAERRRLGAGAAASARRFHADLIAEQWIRMLRSVSVGVGNCRFTADDWPRVASEK